jgi:hypothetical protein
MSMRLSSLGAPLPGFIYATGIRFYKCPIRIHIRTFLPRLQVIFESLFQSTSIMGRTRYTNPWVPEGHTHVSSPGGSTWVKDSGWVSKLQSLTSFNLWLLQSSNFFNLWLLENLTSRKLRFIQSSTSYIFDFFYSLTSSILRLPEIFSPDGSKCWVHGLEIFFLALLKIIFHFWLWSIFRLLQTSNLRLGLSTYLLL